MEGSPDTQDLVRRAGNGDKNAIDELFSRHRKRLACMVRLRLDHRLQGRMDEEDVLQEVYLEAHQRLEEYLKDPKLPFFIWLRLLAGQKLYDLHHMHFGVKARDPRREVALNFRIMPETTSAVLATRLLGSLSTPSQEVMHAELKLKVQQALDTMDPRDREVLVLRHFEDLTNQEAACELGITHGAASKRYIRAILKLREILGRFGGPGADR